MPEMDSLALLREYGSDDSDEELCEPGDGVRWHPDDSSGIRFPEKSAKECGGSAGAKFVEIPEECEKANDGSACGFCAQSGDTGGMPILEESAKECGGSVGAKFVDGGCIQLPEECEDENGGSVSGFCAPSGDSGGMQIPEEFTKQNGESVGSICTPSEDSVGFRMPKDSAGKNFENVDGFCEPFVQSSGALIPERSEESVDNVHKCGNSSGFSIPEESVGESRKSSDQSDGYGVTCECHFEGDSDDSFDMFDGSDDKYCSSAEVDEMCDTTGASVLESSGRSNDYLSGRTSDSDASVSELDQAEKPERKTKKEVLKEDCAKKRRSAHEVIMDHCGCRKNCVELLSHDDRHKINEVYWSMNEQDQPTNAILYRNM